MCLLTSSRGRLDLPHCIGGSNKAPQGQPSSENSQKADSSQGPLSPTAEGPWGKAGAILNYLARRGPTRTGAYDGFKGVVGFEGLVFGTDNSPSEPPGRARIGLRIAVVRAWPVRPRPVEAAPARFHSAEKQPVASETGCRMGLARRINPWPVGDGLTKPCISRV